LEDLVNIESVFCPTCFAAPGLPCVKRTHIARVTEAQLNADIAEFVSKLTPGRHKTTEVRADFINANRFVGQKTFHRIAREFLGEPLLSSGNQFYIVE
jgi:hypothetical protein